MSSLFIPRRRSPEDGGDAEPGSGGKTVRARRPPPEPASPYRRPPPPALPAPESGWISGIFSSAGRIISSVFGSSQSDDDSVSGSSEDEDINTSAEELPASNQRREEQVLIRDHGEASAAIVPSSESKLAIEHLLKQETFSRDECQRLVEILQSRVVDQHNELQPYSSAVLNSSPGYSALQTPTPYLRATAVKEAKKYLEGRKLSSSRSNLDYGPCTLNTDNFHNDNEDEQGSPVDMAKSYMQSLPPWQSSPFSSIGFRTPPHSVTHLYKDHIPVSTGHSLPSSKVLKRSYLSIEPWNTPEEIRRVRTKKTNNLSESSNGELIPSTTLSDHKGSLIASEAERRDAEDNRTNCALGLLDGNANEGKRSKETGIVTCVTVVSKLSEALDVGQLANESRMPTSLLPHQTELGSTTKLSDPNAPISCENQGVEEPPETREVTKNSSHPDEALALLSKPMEHADSRPQDGNCQLLKETEELCHEIAANGPPVEAENRAVLRSWIRDLSPTPKSSNISEPPAHFLEGSSELPSEDFVDVPVNSADSIEPMLTETPPGTSRRGKKTVVRSRRGGRGRGRLK